MKPQEVQQQEAIEALLESVALRVAANRLALAKRGKKPPLQSRER